MLSNSDNNKTDFKMFWSETLKESSKFCICHAAWYCFRLVHIEVIDALLTVHVTPEDGNRSVLFSIRRGEQQTSRLSFDLKFKSFQHVKFEVEGGEITLVGESYDSGRRTKYYTRFLSTCPFADEGDWKREEIDEDPSERYENNNNNNNDSKLKTDIKSDNVFVKENDHGISDNEYEALLRKIDLNKVFSKVDTDEEDIATSRVRLLIREKEKEKVRPLFNFKFPEDEYDDMLLKADLARIFKIQPNEDELTIKVKKKVYEKVMERKNKALLKKEAKNI